MSDEQPDIIDVDNTLRELKAALEKERTRPVTSQEDIFSRMAETTRLQRHLSFKEERARFLGQTNDALALKPDELRLAAEDLLAEARGFHASERPRRASAVQAEASELLSESDRVEAELSVRSGIERLTLVAQEDAPRDVAESMKLEAEKELEEARYQSQPDRESWALMRPYLTEEEQEQQKPDTLRAVEALEEKLQAPVEEWPGFKDRVDKAITENVSTLESRLIPADFRSRDLLTGTVTTGDNIAAELPTGPSGTEAPSQGAAFTRPEIDAGVDDAPSPAEQVEAVTAPAAAPSARDKIGSDIPSWYERKGIPAGGDE